MCHWQLSKPYTSTPTSTSPWALCNTCWSPPNSITGTTAHKNQRSTPTIRCTHRCLTNCSTPITCPKTTGPLITAPCRESPAPFSNSCFILSAKARKSEIDGIRTGGLAPFPLDQSLLNRPVGSQVDIGAIESFDMIFRHGSDQCVPSNCQCFRLNKSILLSWAASPTEDPQIKH